MPCSICLMDVWQWIEKLLTCFTCLDPPLPGLVEAKDALKSQNVDIVGPHYVARLFLRTWWLLLPYSICLMDVWQLVYKLSTCFTCLDPTLPGLRVAMDVPKSPKYYIMGPHYAVRLFLWTSWLLLPYSIYFVGICQWIGKLSTWFTGLDPPLPGPGLRVAMDVPTYHNLTLCDHIML